MQLSPPTSGAGTWFGVDPPIVVGVLLLALASIGFVAWRGLLRGSRRR